MNSLSVNFFIFYYEPKTFNVFDSDVLQLCSYIIIRPYYNIYTQMFKKRNIKKEQINLAEIKQEGEDKIDGEPKKKVKLEKNQLTNLIGGSTVKRKDQNDELVHKKFQSLSYKKNRPIQNQIILAGEEAIDHETEEAKKKYLQNIEMTKKIKEGKLSTKIYRGTNAYANYKLSQSQLENPLQHYKWKHGPTRNNNNNGAKNTCRFDYDPSLCKDWHDSGYCVFGNSCLYLHDRSNYKTGWQLQKDFEKSERERWKRIINPDVSAEPDYIQDLQKFKPQLTCKFCNLDLQSPVQVSCLHIFCKKCAEQIFNKNSKCPECNKRINGIMNNAQKTISTQKQNYQQMLKNAQKNNELSKMKKTQYKDTNSLDVFAAH